jgi:hypothetical protein
MELKAAIYEDVKCVIPTVWRVVAAVVVVIVVGCVWFSSNAAQERLLESERARNAAQEKLLVSQGEREEQERKQVQDHQNLEMKLTQERDEVLKKFFATPTPEDPAKVAKERAAANAMHHYYDAQRYSQQYDMPPGSDATVWGHQTYTDSNGVIWEQKEYTDSNGVIRDRFEPQLPKEVAR